MSSRSAMRVSGGFVDEADGETICAREIDQKLRAAARRASLDRGDGLGM